MGTLGIPVPRSPTIAGEWMVLPLDPTWPTPHSDSFNKTMEKSALDNGGEVDKALVHLGSVKMAGLFIGNLKNKLFRARENPL